MAGRGVKRRRHLRLVESLDARQLMYFTSNSLPSISVIIPTLNSEKTLRESLRSICTQDYPQDKLEIIISDGGSTDSTPEIVKLIGTETLIKIKYIPNTLKTGEAGKAEGFRHSANEIIAFIDSDNILPESNWFLKMVEPFNDAQIFASEPLEYTCRANDGYITRYCAYIGMNDPLCLFLGNYDRYCTLTGRWTEVPHIEEDLGRYLKIELEKKRFPTIGANGFLIRRSALEKCGVGDYLFDIDVIYELLNATDSTGEVVRFAKVKTGIIHIFSGDVKTFARKQRRRIRDYLYYNSLGVRKYPWKSVSSLRLLFFIISCMTLLPLLLQALRGYFKRPNSAWLFHPIACWLTLFEYGLGKAGSVFGVRELRRQGWSQ
ncbi:MAG: glycosyltransferase family 2 protein [Deltaproteobacteria bacterium]|nr:glycosyltransferase family 2 protein [Deltaproteobacteria bacterium]